MVLQVKIALPEFLPSIQITVHFTGGFEAYAFYYIKQNEWWVIFFVVAV